jgi:hypothetical protein
MTSDALRTSVTAAPAAADSEVNVLAAVTASPLQSKPFEYIYMEQVFAPDFYRRMLDALPDTRRYRELKHEDAMQADGHSARRKFYLYPEHLWFLPAKDRAVWRRVSRAMLSDDTQDAFKRKFKTVIERRFGRSIDKLWFFPSPILVRDFGGYRIGIHCDSPNKAITVQFYLPRDERQAHLGTVFHDGRDGEAALRTHTLGFRPATGYAFPVVADHSWHSVARTSPEDGVRDSLMLTYYVHDNWKSALEEWARRVTVWLAYYFRK